MAHAKWKSNVTLPSANRRSACLLVLAVIFSGCQNSEEDYQVITEEMSSPVVEDTNPPESVPTTADLDTHAKTDAVPDSIASKEDEPETVATLEPVEPSQETTPVAQPDEEPAAETTAELANASETQEPQPDENLNGFINIQEEIDRQKRIQKLGLGQTTEPAEPREIKLLVKERDFFKEPKTDAWRVTYNDLDLLKVLNMEPVPLNAQDYLPEWLTALDGKKVILRGWMFPPLQTDGLKGFIFVRDNQVCCFGPNAKAYDKLTVRLKKGNTTSYIQGRPFDVIGTFKLDAWIEDERDMRTGKFIEKLGMLYHIEDAVVVD